MQTRFPFKPSCTPDCVTRPAGLPTVQRKLFSDGQPNCTIDNVASVIGSDNSKHANTTEEDEMVKVYGMVLPSYLLGPDGPQLVKHNLAASSYTASEFPILEQQEMEECARANHELVSAWLQKAEIAKAVGTGKESMSRQAIQVQSKQSSFLEPANKMLQSLPEMECYPIQRCIEDLQQSEAQAMQTTRMYCNKFEQEKCMKKVAAVAAAKKQLSSLTFWRNNIAEQCSCGGKMVNLTLKSLPNKSS